MPSGRPTIVFAAGNIIVLLRWPASVRAMLRTLESVPYCHGYTPMIYLCVKLYYAKRVLTSANPLCANAGVARVMHCPGPCPCSCCYCRGAYVHGHTHRGPRCLCLCEVAIYGSQVCTYPLIALGAPSQGAVVWAAAWNSTSLRLRALTSMALCFTQFTAPTNAGVARRSWGRSCL